MTDAHPPISSQLSPGLAPWLPAFFEKPVPIEKRATCSSCAMCDKPGDTRAKSPHNHYNPATKCCTFQPSLPNFLVGALLSDARPELAEGQARMRAAIARQHGVSPAGVFAPPLFWLIYQDAKDFFGQAESQLCPFYDDGDCTVWAMREAVCSTYFCKFERGQEGKDFWVGVRDYLIGLTDGVARQVALDLGMKSASLVWQNASVTAAELDKKLLPDAEYQRRWGSYAGREEAFFIAAYERACKVDPVSAHALGGAHAQGALRMVEERYERLVHTAPPARLKRNPELTVLPDSQGGHIVEGYSASDASRLGPDLLGALDAFDGRPLAEVQSSLREEGKAVPSSGLAKALYHHRILVDAGPEHSE